MPLIQVIKNRRVGGEHDRLAEALMKACAGVEELRMPDPKDVMVTFPLVETYVPYGVQKTPIVVLVDLLYAKAHRTIEIRKKLAEALGTEMKGWYPNDRIEVFIRTFDAQTEAAWTG